MGRVALIPAAPVLLPDVDLSESESTAEVRAEIREMLTTADHWALPVETLPVLLGLGGFGIDRGIDTRTGERLDGEDWVRAVAGLDTPAREHCALAHPGLSAAALHAHAAGVSIGPIDSGTDVLVPIDLSAAATADAPLAPVDGAQEFDAGVVAAIRDGDIRALRAAVDAAGGVHADLALLDAALDTLAAAPIASRIVLDVGIHDVRTVCAVIGVGDDST